MHYGKQTRSFLLQKIKFHFDSFNLIHVSNVQYSFLILKQVGVF
jgi:hypothetical protein